MFCKSSSVVGSNHAAVSTLQIIIYMISSLMSLSIQNIFKNYFKQKYNIPTGCLFLIMAQFLRYIFDKID
jgi:hypothetical protein